MCGTRGCSPSHSGEELIRVMAYAAQFPLDEERRLNEKRRYNDIPFDVSPVSNAGLQVLDDIAFRRIYLPSAVAQDVLQQNDRTFEEQLLASKFAHPGPPVCPTNLGILSIGKDPTEWIPGAYIQFVRFEGTGLTDSIKTSREIRGALPDLMTELDEILKISIQEALDATSASKEIASPTPLVALQQISRNAILTALAKSPICVLPYGLRLRRGDQNGRPIRPFSAPDFWQAEAV